MKDEKAVREWKRKISERKKLAIKEGKLIWRRTVPYNGLLFKSGWEVITAKWLDENDIEWKYEPAVFELPDGRHYVPDFFLPKLNSYLEVKGYLWPHSKEKMNWFVTQGHKLYVVDKHHIRSNNDIQIALDTLWEPTQ